MRLRRSAVFPARLEVIDASRAMPEVKDHRFCGYSTSDVLSCQARILLPVSPISRSRLPLHWNRTRNTTFAPWVNATVR